MLVHIATNADDSSSVTDQDASKSFQPLICRAKKVLDEAQTLIKSKLVINPESLDDEGIEVRIRTVRF